MRGGNSLIAVANQVWTGSPNLLREDCEIVLKAYAATLDLRHLHCLQRAQARLGERRPDLRSPLASVGPAAYEASKRAPKSAAPKNRGRSPGWRTDNDRILATR